ncbi:MAG: N-acetylmuramoyl-L-alanine amidase [Candidatus Azobacteroides sp.]|nr:N-acetylmuramoyl-L-alanine amidase [Candidatus Azobacteroides sp.]
MANLKYLVIHCTATPEGREVSSEDIRRWHLSAPPAGRGWKQVGYTDMFHLDGSRERLVDNNEDNKVDPWEITNGVAGINNVSRHIVYVGGTAKDGKTAKDTRTAMQRRAMEKYVLDFVRRFPDTKVAGHNRFAAKACPSFDVSQWCRAIGVKEENI